VLEDELARKFDDFRELGIPSYITRDCPVHLSSQVVSTVIGARRCGKSYRTMQAADEMMRDGTIPSAAHVCVVDFDNPVLATLKAADLGVIQRTFFKMNPGFTLKTPIVYILDEIHKIAGWENYVIDLSRNPHWRVIVTGSSSRMLHDEVSTELRGKAISSFVYPLTFREFLRFHALAEAGRSTTAEAAVLRLFDEYLQWGSYPVIPQTPVTMREPLLRQYFDTMVLRDIIQRYDISRPSACIAVLRHLAANTAKPFTMQSAAAFAKQSGYTVNRETVSEYVRWAQDSWLLFSVPLYSSSTKEQERNYKKLYCIDWALAQQNSTAWDGGMSRALENAVFIHMKQRYHRVHYCLTREKRAELDFVGIDSRGKVDTAVQVCIDISDTDVLKRELEPLVSVARYYKCRNSLLLTYGREERFDTDGVTVHALPAWKWMTE
jgi:uncharacterized protein